MHILLFGASGHVGTGLARRLGPDHRITGIVRRPPEPDTPYTPVVVPDWVDEPEQVVAAIATADLEQVDAVIAAIGGWFIGEPVLARGLAKFDEDYADYLRGHFTACTISERLAQTGPRAEPGSRPLVHLALNGVASVEALTGSRAVSRSGAAQSRRIRGAAAAPTTADLHALRSGAPLGGDDRKELSGRVATTTLAAVAAAVESIVRSPDRFELSTAIGASD